MRSSDIARLAGVSVRTLRHYHQLGLLPEPERSVNGYRTYSASDIVKVLRIRRLASLGVPLGRIEPTMDVEEELTLLDQQYAQQIDDLTERRHAIQEVRAHGARVDIPAYARQYVLALNEREGISPRSVEAEREAATVLAHLAGKGYSTTTTVFDGLEVAQLIDAAASLLGLTDSAPGSQIDAAADALVEAIERLRPAIPMPQLPRAAEESLEQHVAEQLTQVQLEAVRRALESNSRARS